MPGEVRVARRGILDFAERAQETRKIVDRLLSRVRRQPRHDFPQRCEGDGVVSGLTLVQGAQRINAPKLP